MNKRTPRSDELAIARARALQDSPLGNLLCEDAAASKQHGRRTARVGVGPDGNPIVYSTDPAVRKAVVHAIQQRTEVPFMDIPPVTALDFQKLLRDGMLARAQREVVDPSGIEPRELPPAGFIVRITEGEQLVEQLGPFATATDADDALRERGERGQMATIYDGDDVAQYRGAPAVYRYGRSRWSRAD